jgi:hypothetical protein
MYRCLPALGGSQRRGGFGERVVWVIVLVVVLTGSLTGAHAAGIDLDQVIDAMTVVSALVTTGAAGTVVRRRRVTPEESQI